MNSVDKNYIRMTESKVSKLILLLGIPTTISMLITNIYNLADTYFVGKISTSAQAATTVLFTLQCIIQAMAFMLGQGAGTHISKSLADKDQLKASKYASSAFFLGVFLGLLLLIFGLIFLEPFVKLLGSSKSALADSKKYGMWIMISAPFMVGALIINNTMRFEGKAFYSMFGLVSGGLLNIFGDWLFITQFDMGIHGAGLSTCLSQIISFGILVTLYLIHGQARLRFKYIALEFKLYFEVLRAGFPSLIRQGLTAVSNGVLSNVCKPYGDSAVAAVGIVNRYANFVLCIAIGIGQGFQPVAAFNYRAKKFDRVKNGLLFTIIFSISCVALLSIFGLVIPRELIYLFNHKKEVIDKGENIMRYTAIGIIFVPICLGTNMLYQSTRQSEIASILALFRSGIIFIPLILILEPIIGFRGIEISQPIAHACAGLLSLPFTILFIRKCKKEESVPNQ